MNLFKFVTIPLCGIPNSFFIFCRVRKRSKRAAHVPRRCALPCASRLRSDAPKLTPLSAGFKQVAASFATADGMLGAGQRELQNQYLKPRIQAHFEGVSSGFLLYSRTPIQSQTVRWPL
jgi:hypothetical protein